MFKGIHCEDQSENLDSLRKKKQQPDSPDSRVDATDRIRRKDNRKKKENTVPDPKYVMLKTDGVADPIPAPSPAKGVQDCCLGSVFMMEPVNKVGGGQNPVKADPCEAELPTSSRQHSVLESLVYVQPGSDNEAVASSSVSPDAGSVPTSHLDTNECDSSVEILQSRQVPADVSLPLELKPDLNMDEDLRGGKVQKQDLLLFSEGDPVADDGGGCFESPFSDFNMFRLNDDLFPCRNAFEGMDQPSMMYRRADVTGSLPFQGSPLLEEDEDEFGRVFRWSSVPDYHPSVQSTIINQSSGSCSTSELSSCYPSVDSKGTQEESEEPKLGQDMKEGKGTNQGMLWHTVMWGDKVMRVSADVLARYRAYSSHMRSRSVSHSLSHSQPEPNSVISHSTMSSPNANGNNSILEGSDNLKILADEAVRVREASVAEAKSKSDLAANLNLPLKKRKSLPPVGNLTSSSGNVVIDGTPSYSSAPMLSIAQVQGMSKSVIVMNSQYSWQNNQTLQLPAAHMKNHNVTAVQPTEDSNTFNKPIDMSSGKKPVYSHSLAAADAGKATPAESFSSTFYCKRCRIKGCLGHCRSSSNQQVKTALKCCKSEDCSGMCKSGKQIIPNYNSPMKATKCTVCGNAICNGKCNGYQIGAATPDKSFKNKALDRTSKVPNGVQKTRHTSGASGSKCSMCQVTTCDGQCKINSSCNVKMKNHMIAHQDSAGNTVLKCFQCKLLGCNGKCMTSHSRCSTSSSGGRKSLRCAFCSVPSCSGTCKTSVTKCTSCFSGNCEGTCHLTGRSTNNSLSTVNDFRILNSSAFVDKHAKCGVCRNVCCGRCKTVSGFKHCPYCIVPVFNGNNINHSIKSILGAGLKSELDLNSELPHKKAKTSTSGRRTRSSASTKQNNSAANSNKQTFSVEDVKRRKKSLSKPVPR